MTNPRDTPDAGLVVRDLIIPVKGVYFDQIASGEKASEYRLQTGYWRKRLEGRSYRNVVLTRGYPKGGGVEGATRLTRAWRGFAETVLTHEHFGGDPVEVFAIDVALPARAQSPDHSEEGE